MKFCKFPYLFLSSVPSSTNIFQELKANHLIFHRFGYFLPLMTILGEIVDLYHAKNHPRFGTGFRSAREWDDHTAEITRQLDIYGQSLKDFEVRNICVPLNTEQSDQNMEGVASTSNLEHNDVNTPSVHSVHTASSNHVLEADVQTRIVVAYGTHVMHVLHILLAGKWDPSMSSLISSPN